MPPKDRFLWLPDGHRRPQHRRICRWPWFTAVSTVLLLGAAAAIGAWAPAGRAVAWALALFALVHFAFLCVLDPESGSVGEGGGPPS